MPIINHPIAGQVPVPDELFVGDDQAEINTRVNNYLADVVAEAVQEQGIELPAFSESAKRIGSETIRGMAEAVSDQRTTTLDQDFMNLVYQRTNPYASFFGGLAGGAGDPTNVLPTPFSKIKMLKKVFGPLLDSKSYLWEAIKKDTAVGALFGALAPEREDYGESTLDNIMYSSLGSGGFGALRGTLGKLAGAKTDTEIQAILDEMKSSELQALNEVLDTAGRTLTETERKAADVQGIKDIGNELELERIRQVGDDFAAERQVQEAKDADVQSIKDVGKELELERIRRVGDDFAEERRVEQVDEVKARVREEKIAELNTRLKSTFGESLGESMEDLNKRLNSLRNKMYATNAEIKKIMQGEKKASAERIKALETRRATLTEDVNQLTTKRDVYNDRRLAAKELVQVKKGKVTDDMAAREKELLGELEAPVTPRVKEPVVPQQVAARTPSVEATAPPRQESSTEALGQMGGRMGSAISDNLKARLWAEYTGQATAVDGKVKQIREQNPNLDQDQLFDVLEGKSVQLRPEQTVLESLQQPAFTDKSVGSARPNILAQPTSAADAATLDLRTKEARELDEPRQSNVNARPEMTPRQSKQQAFMEKQDDNIFNADDVEGNFTFKNMLDAAEDKQRFVEAEIDEGNYKDAAAWLADEFENSSGIMSPANKIVASRIYAIASDNLIKLQDVFRRMEKSGRATAKDIEVLGEMQEDSQLRKAMDVMRNLERIEAQDKKNTSAALNAFKLANKMKKAQMQQLARARTISKLYFGVEC